MVEPLFDASIHKVCRILGRRVSAFETVKERANGFRTRPARARLFFYRSSAPRFSHPRAEDFSNHPASLSLGLTRAHEQFYSGIDSLRSIRAAQVSRGAAVRDVLPAKRTRFPANSCVFEENCCQLLRLFETQLRHQSPSASNLEGYRHKLNIRTFQQYENIELP